MQTYLIDIKHISENIDIFAKAKYDIETLKLNSKQIKQRTSLIDFINSIEINKNVFVLSNNDVMPFNWFYTEDSKYIFYCSTQNEAKQESYNTSLKNLLKYVHEDKTHKFVNVNAKDLLKNDMTTPPYPYFIMQNENYIVESI